MAADTTNEREIGKIWRRTEGASRVLFSTLINHHGVASFPKIPLLAGVQTTAELKDAMNELEHAAYDSMCQPASVFFECPLTERLFFGPLLRG